MAACEPVNPSANDKTDRTVSLQDGRRLGYAEYGDTAGKPVVYCHGGLSSRLDISWAHERCLQQGVRLLAVDRPGMGLSDPKRGRSLLSWAADVRELADALGLQQFPVLGWSLGGPYALACGFALPDLVTAAGMVGALLPTSPQCISELGWFEDRVLLNLNPRHAPIFSAALNAVRVLPPPVVKWFLLTHVSCTSDIEEVRGHSPEYVARLFFEALRQGAAGVLDDYSAVSSDWGFQLSDVRVPIISWQGTEDNICPLSMAKRYNAHFIRGELIEMPELGHFLLLRKLPEILDKLLSVVDSAG
jgi:pimeloyl-ACP methyl ester carboxylesterase